MQVIILDTHPIHDSRVVRHINYCYDSKYDVFRIRIDGDVPFMDLNFITDTNIPCYTIGSNITKYNSINTFIFTTLWALSFFKKIKSICIKIGINFNIDTIIHVHDPILLFLSLKLSKYFKKSKIVYDRHEVYEATKLLSLSYPPYVYRLTEIYTKNKIDGVVTVLDEYVDSVKLLFPKSTVVSIPNYPETSIKYNDIISEKIKNIKEIKTIRFIYIGSLDWSNDRDLALINQIADSILSKYNNVHFLIGGNTNDAKLLYEFSQLSSKYNNRFEYAGYLQHDEAMKETAISTFGFLMIKPDTNYWVLTSPNKVYEYLISGVIPILRLNCANSDILKSCSLWFEREDSSEFILKEIENCLSKPDRIEKLILKSYELGKMFSFDNVSNRYNELYMYLLSHKK